MIRFLICILLTAGIAHAESLTLTYKASTATIAASTAPFQGCTVINDYLSPLEFAPATLNFVENKDWVLKVQPLDANGAPLDYTGMDLFTGFTPDGSDTFTTIYATMSVEPGLLTITVPAAETLKFNGQKGSILFRIVQNMDTHYQMLGAFTAGVKAFPTITRIP